MKKQITIKENGKIKKVVTYTVRDKEHLESQIKNTHKIIPSKKKYNRKKFKKSIDIE